MCLSFVVSLPHENVLNTEKFLNYSIWKLFSALKDANYFELWGKIFLDASSNHKQTTKSHSWEDHKQHNPLLMVVPWWWCHDGGHVCTLLHCVWCGFSMTTVVSVNSYFYYLYWSMWLVLSVAKVTNIPLKVPYFCVTLCNTLPTNQLPVINLQCAN